MEVECSLCWLLILALKGLKGMFGDDEDMMMPDLSNRPDLQKVNFLTFRLWLLNYWKIGAADADEHGSRRGDGHVGRGLCFCVSWFFFLLRSSFRCSRTKRSAKKVFTK